MKHTKTFGNRDMELTVRLLRSILLKDVFFTGLLLFYPALYCLYGDLLFVVLRQVEALAALHFQSCKHTYRKIYGFVWPVCFFASPS